MLFRSTVCDKALVYNYVDKTVSARDLPNINHAAYGQVDNLLADKWSQDADSWSSDLSAWNSPGFVPNTARCIMASNDQKLFLLDGSTSFDGVIANAYLERRGLSFDSPETVKLIKGIRPRIVGSSGNTVKIQVGSQTDPFSDVTWSLPMTHVIGSTIANNCFVSGRYLAIRFYTGSAYQWRLDSYDIDIDVTGKW